MHTPQNPAKIRVLLVEERGLIQAGLSALINAAEGMEVVSAAATAAEAIEQSERLQPDVLLMGSLGEWGVFGAVGEIMQRCPHTRVIVLDERCVDANVREALRVRAAGYLTKQQPFAQIETALRRAVRGDRVFAPQIATRLVLSAEGVRLMPDTTPSPLASLTPRETDVLIHLAQGFSVKQCAKALGIGASTAGNHKSRLMKKLNVHKTVELTRIAIREGLVPETGRAVRPPHIRTGGGESESYAPEVTASGGTGQGARDRHVE
jgi:two-component system invasion response regulator UvrY